MELRGDNTYETVVKDGYPPKVREVVYNDIPTVITKYRLKKIDQMGHMRQKISSCAIQFIITGTSILAGLMIHLCKLWERRRIPVRLSILFGCVLSDDQLLCSPD
jgi:hypothetical protein